jgi:hypothetical protein
MRRSRHFGGVWARAGDGSSGPEKTPVWSVPSLRETKSSSRRQKDLLLLREDLILIKVGPPVTRRPPHRSRRAVFPHRAPQGCSPPHRWRSQECSLWVAARFAIPRSEVCIGCSGISYPAHVSFASYAALSLPSPCGRRYRLGVLWSDLTPRSPSGVLLSGWSTLP